MRKRRLGRTELQVTELGFGAWEIGWTNVDEGDDIGRLLNRVLDSGINFIDSSAAYRWSEELIAKYIGHRRDEFTFATKCGSGRVLQPDGEWVQTLDYSAAAIAPQIDRSLQRMNTDCIDIMQLHSPSFEDVAHGDGLEGLMKARDQGKVRFISLSVDDPAAARKAIEIGEFDTMQVTYNVLQRDMGDIIAAARQQQDMGIIIKVPIASAVFAGPRPEGDAEQWERGQEILSPEAIGDLPKVEAALRWLLTSEDVHTAIVGTTNITHFESNLAAAERGPLPDEVMAAL